LIISNVSKNEKLIVKFFCMTKLHFFSQLTFNKSTNRGKKAVNWDYRARHYVKKKGAV